MIGEEFRHCLIQPFAVKIIRNCSFEPDLLWHMSMCTAAVFMREAFYYRLDRLESPIIKKLSKVKSFMFKTRLAALVLISLLAGCASNPEDEVTPIRPAAEIYESASDYLSSNSYELAIKDLEELETYYPFGEYARQAQLDLISAYYGFDQFDEVVSTANRYARLHPGSEQVAYVTYMKGMANFSRGRGFITNTVNLDRSSRDASAIYQAFADFRTLLEEYPDSKYADDARQRMIYLRNELAQSELHAANFYMRKGAWLSAAKRARYVVEQYGRSDQLEKALNILERSYKELKLDDLAKEVEMIRKDNGL